MSNDLRNRVVLPLVLPIGVLLGIVLFVGALAFMLLYTPRVIGLTFAMVLATAIMGAMSMASAVDEDEMTFGKRAALATLVVVPLAAGLGMGFYGLGENWETTPPAFYEPHLSAPEGAVVGAQNASSFCEVSEDETSCTDTTELTLPAQPEAESFAFLFINYDTGAPHNFQIFELAEGDDGAPAPGEVIFNGPVVQGDEIVYELEDNPFAAGDQLYYNCIVHPNMNGVLTITEAE